MLKWLLVTLAVAAVSIATVALAEPAPERDAPRGPGMAPGEGPRGPMMPQGEQVRRPDPGRILQMIVSSPEAAERAGLNQEQVEQLKELQYKAEKEMIGLRAKVEETRLELRKQMQAEEIDEGAIEKAVDRSLDAEMSLRRFELMQTVKSRKIIGKEAMERIQRAVMERMERARMPGGERPMRGGDEMRPGAGERMRDGQGGEGMRQGGEHPWLQRQMAPPEERRRD